jgi:hypothetical protein
MATGFHAPFFGLGLSVTYLAVAFFVTRNASSIEAAFGRSLILVSVAWLLCFLILAAASISFALPFVLIYNEKLSQL